MKISLAQIQPIPGCFDLNLTRHLQWVEQAIEEQADLVVFPELSLTGYEPSLAKQLAVEVDDARLDAFQVLSDQHGLTIGLGAPIQGEDGVSIGMVVFQPGHPRSVYFKNYLHADELPFFVHGTSFPGLKGVLSRFALAICYELSVPEHFAQAVEQGARYYLASVAKDADGVERALKTMAGYAGSTQIPTLMVNAVGPAEGFDCVGQSAAWNERGELIARLGAEEGLLTIEL